MSTVALSSSNDPDDGPGDGVEFTEDELSTLVAAAEFLYPSEVSVEAGFVETYTRGMTSARKRALKRAVDGVETHARRRFGTKFAALPVDDREGLFRSMNVDTVAPATDGTLSERVRYYIVNGLLYALFTTPKGSNLAGIENPRGYPGGTESYQEEPDR